MTPCNSVCFEGSRENSPHKELNLYSLKENQENDQEAELQTNKQLEIININNQTEETQNELKRF